ncbi:type II toxin-antitoxin system VapC family toxin [Rickettsia tamurae]|uniref:type II toxin-antitoxin system VapC family toxin n=1 Tax=Rickettsia tamurae TaxID=334545 RepID=UPI00068A0C70|nr:type II toxin-antitoxin system VapC family toxin [Rickettsia tamurae]
MSSHNDKSVILDISSLIALLAEEKGQEKISTVNIAEVVKFLIDRKGLTREQTHKLIPNLIPTILPFDEEQAFLSGELITKTKQLGLSLGDRACLALALSKIIPYIQQIKLGLACN